MNKLDYSDEINDDSEEYPRVYCPPSSLAEEGNRLTGPQILDRIEMYLSRQLTQYELEIAVPRCLQDFVEISTIENSKIIVERALKKVVRLREDICRCVA